MCAESEAGAEQHRHHVNMQFIDRTGLQQLPDDIDPADHLHRLVTGGGRRLADGRGKAVGDEGERQALVLPRWGRREPVGEHEDRHLELVVPDVVVRVAHLKGLAAHQDGAGLRDGLGHVRGVLQGREVRIELAHVALGVRDEPVDRRRHPGDHLCHAFSPECAGATQG